MLPYLTVFSLHIPMYGLLIMIGSALGVSFAAYRRRDAAIPRQDVFYAACYAGIGAFLGAKLLYLALTLPNLIASGVPLTSDVLYELFAYGFVFYGGVIGGLGAVFAYSKKYGFSYLPLIETLIPSVPLIHAFGRLGCFCAGCCYGIPIAPPWGVYFSAGSVAPQGVALLPIQLYEAGFNILLFLCLTVYSSKKRTAGRVIGLYLTGYAPARFALEFFRSDAARGFLWGVSTSQWISILMLTAGLFLLIRKAPEQCLKTQAESGAQARKA